MRPVRRQEWACTPGSKGGGHKVQWGIGGTGRPQGRGRGLRRGSTVGMGAGTGAGTGTGRGSSMGSGVQGQGQGQGQGWQQLIKGARACLVTEVGGALCRTPWGRSLLQYRRWLSMYTFKKVSHRAEEASVAQEARVV